MLKSDIRYTDAFIFTLQSTKTSSVFSVKQIIAYIIIEHVLIENNKILIGKSHFFKL